MKRRTELITGILLLVLAGLVTALIIVIVSEQKALFEERSADSSDAVSSEEVADTAPEETTSEDEDDRTVTVYLVRHARTDGNDTGILGGLGGNTPLTENGKEAARKLGERLSDVEFENCYVSSLQRTHDTADIILSENEGQIPEITVVEDISDVDLGEAEGMTPEQALSTYGELFGEPDDEEFSSPSGGESKHDFIERFDEAMKDIVSDPENSGKNILVVTHSSAQWWLSENDICTGDGVLSNTELVTFEVKMEDVS